MDLKDRIKSLALKFSQEIIGIRRHIHKYPEISFQEFRTSEFIASKTFFFPMNSSVNFLIGNPILFCKDSWFIKNRDLRIDRKFGVITPERK